MKKLLIFFLLLQVLDVATTLIVFAMGGQENNPIVAGFLTVGPVAGLLASKILVGGIALLGAHLHYTKGLRMANLAFAGIIGWNFTVIARLAMESGSLHV